MSNNMGSEPPSKKRDRNALSLNNSSSDNSSTPETMDINESILKVKPLIILDLKELNSNQTELNGNLNIWLSDCKATVKFTYNNNLLIYPETENDRNQLLGKNLNYRGKKILELAPKGIELVMKGLTYEDAHSFEKELSDNHLVNLKEMKSFNNPSIKLKKVKLLCNDQNHANVLLNDGIALNYQKFHFEPFKHKFRLTQCYKCQELGHVASKCSAKKICIGCSSPNHETDANGKLVCDTQTKKCTLCGGDHSNAFSNCPKKIERINEISTRYDEVLQKFTVFCEHYFSIGNNDYFFT